MKTLLYCMIAIALLSPAAASVAGQMQSTPGGVQYEELVVGSGTVAAENGVATMHFILWIDNSGTKGSRLFSSYEHGRPVTFKIGTDKVIKGWNEGVAGMQPGGKRRLYVPARMAYGAKGAEDMIPLNANLIYEVELISVK